MSRIGFKEVTLPEGVEVKRTDNTVTVKGPKGELTREFSDKISMEIEGKTVKFDRESDDNKVKALHGTTRALFHNMVLGVTEGFKKELELQGVGYRAQMKGNKLVLSVGYSHPVEFEPEEGLKVETPSATSIIVSGISKEEVGDLAARIRLTRAPEPYKGKGIRYVGEYVRRKEGKTGK
ncbi:50S ribosomal protein L6 [Liquorilactobacillus satsumensis]|uniref:Large ribosomal subunit protein uL6 n=1 Tax=Liquorilactobacillus satsumensis DSM 16230 = JCM 12392 TaxID=1423801 RepID=A0A0R1V3N1_9LACO|nr:50S ribosomal protein L6 [Liquorilactobacillus satsumensis]KRL97864.1 50S ribosomal protein L6P [Liquorilactobacillus satsumensis DSM 16230 = JCM 12392]MCC7667631.1 50S ribosomal protein L6 [Liquorilactobacillus satsumensis]MCP9313167.1 50S ribosomal protein L6 [Liquorilactobacillus satsumensis]MCP9329404.1 50S ribosomal protein L6 [Liquorilactobacillus satsumensis]MCP9357895.1 50S ribosomal protein L6 [Liquorilactobacillus satsumensis]